MATKSNKKPSTAQKVSRTDAPQSLDDKLSAPVATVKPPKRPKAGQPSSYCTMYEEQARKLCLLGYTDGELAKFFGVAEATLNNWKISHPEFLESIRAGKDDADAKVADSLYNRALGYSHPEVDIRVVAGGIVQTPIIKHYPPDTPAGIHWLNNRQRHKWRTKVDNEHFGPDGGAIKHDVTLSPDEAYLRLIGR